MYESAMPVLIAKPAGDEIDHRHFSV